MADLWKKGKENGAHSFWRVERAKCAISSFSLPAELRNYVYELYSEQVAVKHDLFVARELLIIKNDTCPGR